MQTIEESGKYVTDGKHTYPYNAFLDEMIQQGKLQYCDKPAARAPGVAPTPLRSPLTMTQDERMALAKKLDITLGDLGNMSPQELAEAEAELAAEATTPAVDGFPKED